MSNENKYKGLTWLSDEGRVHLIYLDRLVETQNIDEVFSLKENSDFSTTLHQIFVIKYDKKPKSLNEPQLNLLLCMHLENAGQSSSILSCLQEWFPEHLDKFVSALSEINAPKCAYAIDKAIKLLPEDGSWFFEKADEESQELMSKYDSLFSDYPDGNMPTLYRKYAEQNIADIIKINTKNETIFLDCKTEI